MSLVLSEIIVIRKMFYDYMIKNSKLIESPSLTDNLSPKLKKLMDILFEVQRSDICLIFVDRRTTAKVLYHFMKVFISYFLIFSCFINQYFHYFVPGLHS